MDATSTKPTERQRRSDYLGPRVSRDIRMSPETLHLIKQAAGGAGNINAWCVAVLGRAAKRAVGGRTGKTSGALVTDD